MYAKLKTVLSYVAELARRARRRDVKAIAILALLLALPPLVAAATYTWSALLVMHGTVVKSEVYVKTVEIDFGDEVPSGDIVAEKAVGEFSYPGKLGLVYSFNVSTTAPEAVMASLIPVLIYPAGVGIEALRPHDAWAGLIILLPNDTYEEIKTPEAWSRMLEHICRLWTALEMTEKHEGGVELTCGDFDNDNYTDMRIEIYGIVVEGAAAEAKIATVIVPGDITKIARCPVEDNSGVCLVVPAVGLDYPFYLVGGEKYRVEVMPHVITKYVYEEKPFEITIKLVGNPPLLTS